jgi:hypothetical protein
MKIKLNQNILEIDLNNFLKNILIEYYNKVKDNPNPNKKDLKYLGYHAIAYFQYLNVLSVNKAIALYKNYILTDGKDNTLTYRLYYTDGIVNKIKTNEINIPLYFDNLLQDISKYLMNYKNIIKDITKDGYTKYFKKKYKIKTSDITTYAIIDILEKIKIHTLVALERHWTTINKEILPVLLQKTQVIESKN